MPRLFEPIYEQEKPESMIQMEISTRFPYRLYSPIEATVLRNELLVKHRFREIDSEITVLVKGKPHFLRGALGHIADEIKAAAEILDFSFDWDENGGQPTDLATYNKAITFIVQYANWIEEHLGVVLSAPVINLMGDGGIYVQWKTKNGKLLIVFKKDGGPLSYFYAERTVDKIPYKSAVANDAPVDSHLARWMGEFLGL